VIKDRFKEWKLHFYYRRGLLTLKIQMYKCKKCGKKFKTDISEVVDDNSNFTNEFKESAWN